MARKQMVYVHEIRKMFHDLPFNQTDIFFGNEIQSMNIRFTAKIMEEGSPPSEKSGHLLFQFESEMMKK